MVVNNDFFFLSDDLSVTKTRHHLRLSPYQDLPMPIITYAFKTTKIIVKTRLEIVKQLY